MNPGSDAHAAPPASIIARLVGLCAANAWGVLALGVLFCIGVTTYVAGHFSMTTDTYALLSPKLDWRMRETAFNEKFPDDISNVVVVIDGRTPELSEAAAAALAAALTSQPRLFHAVERPDGGPFWAHEGLLFGSTDDVKAVIAQLLKAQPFLGPLAVDPSLRGVMQTLSLALQGVGSGQAALADLRTPIHAFGDALHGLAAGTPTYFSWSELLTGHAPDARELRHLVLVDPLLDYTQLQPGAAAAAAIRAAVRTLRLEEAHGVTVRLTGSVPLQDEEFGTLEQGAELIAGLAGGAIVLMLWLAVRSIRLIAGILVTTLLGLIGATALGLAIYHRFNVISVAFIPLFVGLGIDIGIQFSVRYRAERVTGIPVQTALVATGQGMGRSLTLAATAIAVGFLAFGPTAYYGVSQLGVIAGLGMFLALLLNLTLLPALITLTRAPGGTDRHTDARLTRIDAFVLGHRRLMLWSAVAAAVVCMVLLRFVHFDFNPMDLRSADAESVSTLYDLMRDPEQSPNTLELVRPSLAAADALAAQFRTDPTVGSVHTLSSLIPADQTAKLALLADAADLLDLTLNPLEVAPPPTDIQLVDSLRRTAAGLRDAHSDDAALHTEAQRLADELDALAAAGPPARLAASQLLVPGFVTVLGQMRSLLQPQPLALATLPPGLGRQWVAPDGEARLSIVPKGDSNDVKVLARFIAAGVRRAPDVTGTAISLEYSGNAVANAFVEAGVLSFVAITGLLLLTLRRLRDVAITMAPIVLTGLLTMGTCVLIRQPLNFANIIALPLLFGIGVAFHIYFVMSWRAGGSHLLTSSLARGVFFSALATATRIRQPVGFEPSGHGQHGQAADDFADMDAGLGAALPARADGPLSPGRRRGRAHARRRAAGRYFMSPSLRPFRWDTSAATPPLAIAAPKSVRCSVNWLIPS